MQIGVPTQCMTDVQVERGDKHITNVKSDANFCFLPASYGYLR